MASTVEVPPLPSFCTSEWFKAKILPKHKCHSNNVTLDLGQQTNLSGGYLSFITKVGLRWNGSGIEQLPNSVIVKVVTVDKFKAEFVKNAGEEQAETAMEAFKVGLVTMHNNECFVYDRFLPIPNVPSAICYATFSLGTDSNLGMMVIEDLSEVGTNIPIDVGFTYSQAKNMITAIALMQAHSLRDDFWKKELAPLRKEDFAPMSESIELMYDVLKTEYPAVYDFLTVEQVREFSNVDAWMEVCFTAQVEHEVFVHGDIWANNILTRTKNGEFTDECAGIIDWQTAHRGQPGEDVARIIATHMTGEERRENEWGLLDYYYATLTEALGKIPPFDMEYLKYWYKRSMDFQCAFGFMLHALRRDNLTYQENIKLGIRVTDLIKDKLSGRY